MCLTKTLKSWILSHNYVIFLEDDYTIDLKPNDRFDLSELSDTPRKSLEGSSNPMEVVPKTTTISLLDIRELCHSERIVKAPDQFMFLGEVVSDEFDLDPSSYNETIFDKDLEN